MQLPCCAGGKLSPIPAGAKSSTITTTGRMRPTLDATGCCCATIAEQEIYSQFDRLRQDKTTFFVSHRLSCATIASKILVLQDGQLVEEGSHSQLMAQQGIYYTLFSTQAKHYLEVEQ